MKTQLQLLLGLHALMFCTGLSGQIIHPLDQWQVIAQPSGSIRGLAYKDGHFVAVGTRTNIIVSTNGSDWFLTQTGLTNFLGGLGVAEGAGQFVAVGYAGTIVSSPDGSEWTVRRTGAARLYEEFWAITYGGGRFVTVGFEYGGAAIAAISTNGIQWEKFSLPIMTTPRNVVYAEGFYVAAGSPVSMYSTNGRDWRALSGVLAQGIAYGSGQFIATLITNGFSSTNVVTFTDGVASTNEAKWTQFSMPAPGTGASEQDYYTVRYANGTFIAGGHVGSSGLLASSTNGREWTLRPLGSGTNAVIRDVVFVDGSFYLADQMGRIWKSNRMPPSSPPLATQVMHEGERTALSFAAVAGYHYTLECSDGLGSSAWTPCGGPLFATGNQLNVTDLGATAQSRFYRLRVE